MRARRRIACRSAAERANLPEVLYDFFAFGPDHKAVADEMRRIRPDAETFVQPLKIGAHLIGEKLVNALDKAPAQLLPSTAARA